MSKLRTKVATSFRRFSYRMKHDFLTFDNILLAAAIILVLFWTYSAIVAMSRNWKLAETLAEKKRELAILELEVETIELENNYYRSSEFQELTVRRLYNRKNPGENLVYLPENSVAAKTKHQAKTKDADSVQPASNLEQWLTFLFGV